MDRGENSTNQCSFRCKIFSTTYLFGRCSRINTKRDYLIYTGAIELNSSSILIQA